MQILKAKKMKHVIFVVIGSLLISSCILLPEERPEPIIPTPSRTNSPTPAGIIIPPTATLSATDTSEIPISETETTQPTETYTPLPTYTETSQPTDEPTETPEPTPIPYIYEIQNGTPAYIKNFAHPEVGCEWIGVGGQIFDESSRPVLSLVALVSGSYGGKQIEAVGVSGTGEGDNYGPGGFEIVVSNKTLSTQDQLNIQLFNLDGLPVSEVYSFDTYNDCDKNLVIINFVSIN